MEPNNHATGTTTQPDQEKDVKATTPKKSPAKKKAKAQVKSPSAPKKAAAKRSLGVIGTVFEQTAKADGATQEEILDVLSKRFKDRDPDSMKTTVSIQVTRLPKTYGFKMEADKNDKRGGIVYKAPHKAFVDYCKSKGIGESSEGKSKAA